MGGSTIDHLAYRKGDSVLLHLAASDSRMGWLIDRVGDVKVRLETDYFTSLAGSIVGQQLSPRVANVIWSRVCDLCDAVRPDSILRVSEDELRKTGVSRPKASYLRDLAAKVSAGDVDLDRISLLDDEEVIDALTTVKGIGRWTAEMFLIFSLGRLDVLSTGDLGLRRAMQWLYGLDSLPDPAVMAERGSAWKPYRSVGSLYLWEAIDRGYLNNPGFARG